MYSISWYWNWKTQISPSQKNNFDRWSMYCDKIMVSNKVSFGNGALFLILKKHMYWEVPSVCNTSSCSEKCECDLIKSLKENLKKFVLSAVCIKKFPFFLARSIYQFYILNFIMQYM